MDCFVKPPRGFPCRLSILSNLLALTIQLQIRDVFIANGAWSTSGEAVLKKLDAVLPLIKQFLRTSTNLKKFNVIFLMAGASARFPDKAYIRVFPDEVDRLLGMEGRLVRGRSRSSNELFDDDGILITGYRALDSIYISGRTDEFKWNAPKGQGLRAVKETQRLAKYGSAQWF